MILRVGVGSLQILFLLILATTVAGIQVSHELLPANRPCLLVGIPGCGVFAAGDLSPIRVAELWEDDGRIHHGTRAGDGEAGSAGREGSAAETDKLDKSWDMLRNMLIAPEVGPSRDPRHQRKSSRDGFRSDP